MTDMLRDLIRQADEGRCVYLSRVRDTFRKMDIQIGCRVDLTLGGTMSYLIRLPLPRDPVEDAFVREYFYARIYNLISVLGGKSMTLTVPAGFAWARELCGSLLSVFDVGKAKSERKGYGKCLNVTDRANEALRCAPFRFLIEEGEPQAPAPKRKAPGRDAASAFRRAVLNARSDRLCGMDVGGTDIKVVGVLDGKIRAVKEYDWHPAMFRHIDELIQPLLLLARVMRAALSVTDDSSRELLDARERMLDKSAPLETMDTSAAQIENALDTPGFDAIGVCFPDVVIDDMIVGGETLKTRGIREASPDYEKEFPKLTVLKDLLGPYLASGGLVRMANDGSMAAYTAAAELTSCPGKATEVPDGIFAHTLGTELGSGWIDEEGKIPQIPLEVYNCIIDLGSRPARAYGVLDLRSTRNFNTGIAGTLQKYASQSGAYRLMFKHFNEGQLRELYNAGLIIRRGGGVFAVTDPADMRKPLLERVMSMACQGIPEAEEVFREIGEYLAVTWEETEDILCPMTKQRVLFGRFVKKRRVFELMQEGAARLLPVMLQAADDSMAYTPLMLDLRNDPVYTVAQFGQAVGAVYYAAAGRVL